MSLQRKFERHRLGAFLSKRPRGNGCHIICTEKTRELHATKGWRRIPKSERDAA